MKQKRELLYGSRAVAKPLPFKKTAAGQGDCCCPGGNQDGSPSDIRCCCATRVGVGVGVGVTSSALTARS